MTGPRTVRSFVSSSPEYHRAFQAFLAHTDQKDKAREWLRHEVNGLANRSVMIDAGAGSGKLTSWLTPLFGTVIAIEPNPSMESELRIACPDAVVIAATIASASPPAAGDFVLCSHVFYHIPRSQWESTLLHLMGWLAPGGVLAVALQNPRADCMRMVNHFLGGRLDLSELCPTANAEDGEFEARLETVPAHIRAPDLGTACEIAEFFLNDLPMPAPPRWEDLEHYVNAHFKQAEGGYQLSCHQDFLRVSRSVGSPPSAIRAAYPQGRGGRPLDLGAKLPRQTVQALDHRSARLGRPTVDWRLDGPDDLGLGRDAAAGIAARVGTLFAVVLSPPAPPVQTSPSSR